MKFLLDTNFLLIPFKFRVDVFSELEEFGKPELYTLDLVLKELEKIKTGSFALEFIKKKKVKILKSLGKNTDNEIERMASEKNFVVCTQDRKLIKKLKIGGIKVVYLRQKKYLVMI